MTNFLFSILFALSMISYKGIGCEQAKKSSNPSMTKGLEDSGSLILLADNSKTKDSKKEDNAEDDDEKKSDNEEEKKKDKDEDTTNNSIRCKTSRAAVTTFNCTP